MKRNSKVKKINELLSDFFTNKKTDKLEIINPFKLWIQVMGIHIKSETKNVYIKDNTLYYFSLIELFNELPEPVDLLGDLDDLNVKTDNFDMFSKYCGILSKLNA